MNSDDFKQAWQAQSSQARMTMDADAILTEVRRNQQAFNAIIFWRDVREVGVAIVLIPIWIFMGVNRSLPWTWYLTIPALLWIAGFMLIDRRLHKGLAADADEPLIRHVAGALAEVDHQIWLLRNVFWWYLLPILLSCLAFFAQVAWQTRAGGLQTVLGTSFLVAFVGAIFAGIYWLNQHAVRTSLIPKRRELEALLLGLKDETSDASS